MLGDALMTESYRARAVRSSANILKNGTMFDALRPFELN